MEGSKEKNKTTGYTDISIMDYEGLALKKVAYDVLCFKPFPQSFYPTFFPFHFKLNNVFRLHNDKSSFFF